MCVAKLALHFSSLPALFLSLPIVLSCLRLLTLSPRSPALLQANTDDDAGALFPDDAAAEEGPEGAAPFVVSAAGTDAACAERVKRAVAARARAAKAQSSASPFKSESGGMLSVDGKRVFFVGVIDFLIHYGSKKKMERMLRGYHPGVSCAPPTTYANRFTSFIDTIVE